MAAGFGTTYGTSGTGDEVELAYAGYSVTRSYSFWMWDHGLGGSNAGRAFAKGADVEIFYQIGSSKLEYHVDWGTTDGKWTITRPTQDVWHQVVITYDGGATTNEAVVYIDGASVTVTNSSEPAGTINSDSGSTYSIGNRAAGDRAWDGMIADWAKWNVILTASEAAALGKGMSPRLIRPGSLVEFVPLVREMNSVKNAASAVSGALAQPHPRIFNPKRRQIILPASSSSPGGSGAANMLLLGVG